MVEFIEDCGTLYGDPVILQGIVEDGEVIAVKMIDPSDMMPLTWALEYGVVESIKKVLQHLYNNAG